MIIVYGAICIRIIITWTFRAHLFILCKFLGRFDRNVVKPKKILLLSYLSYCLVYHLFSFLKSHSFQWMSSQDFVLNQLFGFIFVMKITSRWVRGRVRQRTQREKLHVQDHFLFENRIGIMVRINCSYKWITPDKRINQWRHLVITADDEMNMAMMIRYWWFWEIYRWWWHRAWRW